MSLTNKQEGRLLERIAAILHEDPDTEGLYELADAIGANHEECCQLVRRERDTYLRRAAKLLGSSDTSRGGGCRP